METSRARHACLRRQLAGVSCRTRNHGGRHLGLRGMRKFIHTLLLFNLELTVALLLAGGRQLAQSFLQQQ